MVPVALQACETGYSGAETNKRLLSPTSFSSKHESVSQISQRATQLMTDGPSARNV